MEHQRFEDLTRGLAAARSRRDVVKTLFGALLAGGAVAAQRGGVVAQDPCTTDDDCDTGICCAGFCRDIECCIDDDDPNARCPEGTSCFEGVCDPVTEPGACASDDECGDDEICCAGFCRAIECCIDDEDPNARCPEGTSCFEGVCDPIDDAGQQPPVVALPETGTGPDSGGGSSMVSAILAGGAAVAAGLGLRARRSRPSAEESKER